MVQSEFHSCQLSHMNIKKTLLSAVCSCDAQLPETAKNQSLNHNSNSDTEEFSDVRMMFGGYSDAIRMLFGCFSG